LFVFNTFFLFYTTEKEEEEEEEEEKGKEKVHTIRTISKH
jgi:hypothetical protein